MVFASQPGLHEPHGCRSVQERSAPNSTMSQKWSPSKIFQALQNFQNHLCLNPVHVSCLHHTAGNVPIAPQRLDLKVDTYFFSTNDSLRLGLWYFITFLLCWQELCLILNICYCYCKLKQLSLSRSHHHPWHNTVAFKNSAIDCSLLRRQARRSLKIVLIYQSSRITYSDWHASAKEKLFKVVARSLSNPQTLDLV